MKPIKIRMKLAVLAAAVALASCGGDDDDRRFSTVVSFGDSLSDVGSYRTAGIAQVGGGKYTVNGPDGKIWVERIAETLSLPAPCAAQTGLEASGQLAAFAGPVTTNAGCTAYGQGGSRVTDPVGPWNKALLASSDPETKFTGQLGQTTVPVVTQVQRYLASKNGSFTGSELVLVLAGGNDAFMFLDEVGTTKSPQQAAAAMAQAGTELAALVKNQMVAKGARYVVVVNLPNISVTPSTIAAEKAAPGSKAVTDAVTQAFNASLATGLAGVNNVIQIDAYKSSTDQAANPAAYGFTNVTTPACSSTSQLNPLAGYSLTCTTASTIAGDTSRYEFADSVHPTPYAHSLLAVTVLDAIKKAGWP